jgi:hypothetical protein
MKDADGVREVERPFAHRKREDVSLREVDVRQVANVAVGGVDRPCEIDAEDFGAFRGGALGESARAHARVQQPAPAILLVVPARRGAQRRLGFVRAVEGIHLDIPEPMPLTAEASRVGR